MGSGGVTIGIKIYGGQCPPFYIMKNFKHEERFLENHIEKNNELLSIIQLDLGHGISPYDLISRPKFTEFFLDGIEGDGGPIYLDAIFTFDEDIYIYLSKTEPMISSFSCKIYYPIRKRKDVEFFILNLKKSKKNGN